jgi:hypothetical protein
MSTIVIPPMAESTTDKRFRLSWTKKKTPLKHSTLFNKAKHSEEWHQSIDQIAGALHPSDPEFPYAAIKQATDTYLKKKGKITHEDAAIRLSILVDAHEAKDIAIAATAHIISVASLRSRLQAELNVAQGSYWGLEMWLQCIIAASLGNSASFTALEEFWARQLLPFATHGAEAAGMFLEGVSKFLYQYWTPNLNDVPEFSVLVHRALSDVARQLEGLRLKCDWAAASTQTAWMTKLRTESAGAPPGSLLPVNILNSSFPVWQIWANWRPQIDRIVRLDGLQGTFLAVLPDILALEGPDFITGKESSLRDGLISRYAGTEAVVKFQGLLFEVPDRERDSLRALIERLAKALDFVCIGAASTGSREGLLTLFTELTIVRPITAEILDLLEAIFAVSYTPANDIYNTVWEILVNKNKLRGSHVFALQSLLHTFVDPQAENLRKILLTPWLIDGIVTCFEDCRAAVRTQIDNNLPWTQLALEFHGFCIALDDAKDIIAQGIETASRVYIPDLNDIKMAIEIHEAAYAQRPRSLKDSAKGSSAKDDKSTADFIQPSASQSTVTRHPLETIMEEFYLHHLLDTGKIGRSCERSVEAIFKVWKSSSGPTIDRSRRELAILVTKTTGRDYILRCRYLDEITSGHQLSLPDAFIGDALRILRDLNQNVEQSFIDFTALLSNHKSSGQMLSQCWIDFVYRWLGQDPMFDIPSARNLLEYSLKTMKAAEWIQFMNQIENLFADKLIARVETIETPPILQRDLLNWKKRVIGHTDTITRLETALGDNKGAIICILSPKRAWTKGIFNILRSLRGAEGKATEPLLQMIVEKMTPDSCNALEIADCMHGFQDASADTIEACMKIWDASHGTLNIPGLSDDPENLSLPSQKRSTCYSVPRSVVEVMVAGWMQDGQTDLDKVAIHSLACLLKIRVYNFDLPKDKLREAAKFWERVQNDIVKEAERLEELQAALLAEDPTGTANVLEQLGISDITWIDREIAKLPAHISKVVKKAADNQIEISFPLRVYKELQRKAMGIPFEAHTLMLRVSLERPSGDPPSFCLHYKTEPGLAAKIHTPYVCSQVSQSPSELYCATTQTAFTWQLSRILHHHIQNGDIGIESLHRCVTTATLGQSCISCGAAHDGKNAYLRRSTPCDLQVCEKLWQKLPLEVRIPEIRTDPFAVDLVLMSVYAAALTERAELLPGCPIQEFYIIKSILNSLPTLRDMKEAPDLSKFLWEHHKDAEALISWACTHHRSYLTTATGACGITNLPWEAHQFILANVSPRLEGDFTSRLPRKSSKTTVLFHGTSFDRLPAILAQGLRVCSGTPLQSVGAVHGSGIYLAEEPKKSIDYAPMALTWKNSGLGSMRLLLGCEVVGSGHKVAKGIHLVTDPASVMVRYLFLFPNWVKPPAAKEISRDMAGVMSSLRTGET